MTASSLPPFLAFLVLDPPLLNDVVRREAAKPQARNSNPFWIDRRGAVLFGTVPFEPPHASTFHRTTSGRVPQCNVPEMNVHGQYRKSTQVFVTVRCPSLVLVRNPSASRTPWQ
jgi:hypothetical protein